MGAISSGTGPKGQRITLLDQIIYNTLEAIDKGRIQVHRIAEQARNEYLEVKQALERLKEEVAQHIERVDKLEQYEKQARLRLAEVSRDFQRYTEDQVREAYEEAEQAQVELSVAREREKMLRQQRDMLERRLRSLEEMARHAESLVSTLGVAMDYLTGNLLQVGDQLRKLEEKRDFGLAVMMAQEEERRRVAREIHDGPAQVLANVVLRVDICQRLADTDPQRLKAELEELKNLIRLSLQDVRQVIFDLRPMALDDLGLVPTLRSYLADFEQKAGVTAKLVVLGQEQRYVTAYEVAIFRLVQEALNNVQKHAAAQEVQVTVEFLSDKVQVQVRDDGRGFDPALLQRTAVPGQRFGLIGMSERTDLLQGQMRIESSPGAGTTLRFTLPADARLQRKGEDAGTGGKGQT